MSRVPFFLCMTFLVMLAQLPALHAWLAWDKSLILQGEWWRLLTGNLTHTNFTHALINLGALALLLILFAPSSGNRAIMYLFLLLMFSIGLATLASSLVWYAGLSGVLHGFFVWCVLRAFWPQKLLASLSVFGLLCKLFIEYQQDNSYITELIAAKIAYQTHWLGAVFGLLFFALSKVFHR
ncbi:MAG: rhombosortase [Vibrionaceae bacterium]